MLVTLPKMAGYCWLLLDIAKFVEFAEFAKSRKITQNIAKLQLRIKILKIVREYYGDFNRNLNLNSCGNYKEGRVFVNFFIN